MSWFPLGLADEKAFCNRTEERAYLKTNIENHIHTVVIASRRYGKTSLIKKVIKDEKYLYTFVDFLVIANLHSAQQLIADSVNDLLIQQAPTMQKLKPLLTKFFKAFKPTMSLDMEDKLKLDLSLGIQAPQQNIIKILEALDLVAQSLKQKIVLFFDEFQQIETIDNGGVLEGAIRHVAQSSKALSFIFSGSNRHLLAAMFDNKERPLYRLCDQIHLKRIGTQHYEKHLQKASKSKWKNTLPSEAINQILMLTRRHPYCLNMLCSRLWLRDNVPTKTIIQKTWEEYVDQESRSLSSEINRLSANQRAVLLLLSIYPFSQPTSQEVSSKLNLPSTSIAQANRVLLDRDFIYKDQEIGIFEIVNPVIKEMLKPYAAKLF